MKKRICVGIIAVALMVGMVGLTGQTIVSPTYTQTPQWVHYDVVKIADGAADCASANGCWSVNGGASVVAAAASTQDVTIAEMPAYTFLEYRRIKTTTACTGAGTVIVDSVFTTAANAVSDTNLADQSFIDTTGPIITPSVATFHLKTHIGVGTGNVSDIVAGCAVRISILAAVTQP